MSSDNRSANPEKVVQIRRCACVVKGGRRFSFTALVVVGDGNGKVGWGYAKGTEVPVAVDKAVKRANGRLVGYPAVTTTVPHEVVGRFGASKVVLIPGRPGTGIIAGASVHAVVEAVGITDILTKSLGSNNPTNLVKATFNALEKLRSKDEIERLRGVEI